MSCRSLATNVFILLLGSLCTQLALVETVPHAHQCHLEGEHVLLVRDGPRGVEVRLNLIGRLDSSPNATTASTVLHGHRLTDSCGYRLTKCPEFLAYAPDVPDVRVQKRVIVFVPLRDGLALIDISNELGNYSLESAIISSADSNRYINCSPGKVFSLFETGNFYASCYNSSLQVLQVLDVELDLVTLDNSRFRTYSTILQVYPEVGTLEAASNLLIFADDFYDAFAVVAIGRTIFVLEPYYYTAVWLSTLPQYACFRIQNLVRGNDIQFHAVCPLTSVLFDIGERTWITYSDRQQFGTPIDCPNNYVNLRDVRDRISFANSEGEFVTQDKIGNTAGGGGGGGGVCVGNQSLSYFAYPVYNQTGAVSLVNLRNGTSSIWYSDDSCADDSVIRGTASLQRAADRYIVAQNTCRRGILYVYDVLCKDIRGSALGLLNSIASIISLHI